MDWTALPLGEFSPGAMPFMLLFTTPTHLAAGLAVLFLSYIFLQGPDISLLGVMWTLLFSILPDAADNPRSWPGTVFSSLVRTLTLGRVELGRYFDHRGFWHSLSALALLSLLAYAVSSSLAAYLLLGMGSHIYIDSFQQKGVSLLGFGEWRMRIAKNLEIPSGRQEEAFFAAAALLVVGMGIAVQSYDGSKMIICRALGTLECTIRTLEKYRGEEKRVTLVLTSALRQPAGGEVLSGSFADPEAGGRARLIFWKDGVPFSLGHSVDDNFLADRNAHIEAGLPRKTCRFGISLRSQMLGDLKEMLAGVPEPFHLSGNVLLRDGHTVKIFHYRYNTVAGKGNQLKFTFAGLNDLDAYELAHLVAESADLELVYYVEPTVGCRWEVQPVTGARETFSLSFQVQDLESVLVKQGERLRRDQIIARLHRLDGRIGLLEAALTSKENALERLQGGFARERKMASQDEARLKKDLREAEKRVADYNALLQGDEAFFRHKLNRPSLSQLELRTVMAETKRTVTGLIEKEKARVDKLRSERDRQENTTAKARQAFKAEKEKLALEIRKAREDLQELRLKREVKSPVPGRVIALDHRHQNGLYQVKLEILAEVQEAKN
ncbi:MAG: metal-dependent hydrolase [Chloroflexi bacterium]|nr:metal-dependent hydrolase [Chloroflexota bacterium]